MTEMSGRASNSRSDCCISSVIGISIMFSGGCLKTTRATGAPTSTSIRVVDAVAILSEVLAELRSAGRPGAAVPTRASLNVNRRLARLANGRQRIARALFLSNPLLFVADNVEQQQFILGDRQIFFAMLLVAAIVQRLARLAVELLPRPFSNVAVEVDVGRVQLLLARLQKCVQPLHQPGHFLTIKVAAVIIQVVEVSSRVILQFVVPALDSPDVGPMRRRRMVRAKKIE